MSNGNDTLSQAEIDAQYNPSLALAPDASPMAHYTAQAEAARAQDVVGLYRAHHGVFACADGARGLSQSARQHAGGQTLFVAEVDIAR